MKKNNKEILDELVIDTPKIKKMTYIELGIFLQALNLDIDWISLGEAHDYLGGYVNEGRDMKIKQEINEMLTMSEKSSNTR